MWREEGKKQQEQERGLEGKETFKSMCWGVGDGGWFDRFLAI